MGNRKHFAVLGVIHASASCVGLKVTVSNKWKITPIFYIFPKCHQVLIFKILYNIRSQTTVFNVLVMFWLRRKKLSSDKICRSKYVPFFYGSCNLYLSTAMFLPVEISELTFTLICFTESNIISTG